MTTRNSLVMSIKSRFWEDMRESWVMCPLCSEEWNRLDLRHNFCVQCIDTVKSLGRIAGLYPAKAPFENWPAPQIQVRPIPGRRHSVRVNSMDQETGERIQENVPIWEAYEARINWGGNDCTIYRDGQLFKVDFGDDEPLICSDAMHAWNLFKKMIPQKVSGQKKKSSRSSFTSI